MSPQNWGFWYFLPQPAPQKVLADDIVFIGHNVSQVVYGKTHNKAKSFQKIDSIVNNCFIQNNAPLEQTSKQLRREREREIAHPLETIFLSFVVSSSTSVTLTMCCFGSGIRQREKYQYQSLSLCILFCQQPKLCPQTRSSIRLVNFSENWH